MTILAIALALPAAAAAQTPADIARQLWPLGAPAAGNTQPAAGAANAGAFTARDLAKTFVAGNPSNTAPAGILASAFGPADLVRLRGDGQAAPTVTSPGDYLVARIGEPSKP